MIKFTSTMGVNFSNYFQRIPIDPTLAATEIAGLPGTSAKTFSHQGGDLAFMKAAQARKLTLAYAQNPKDVSLPYCLFTAGPEQWAHDGNYTYTNILDAMLDALHVALGRIGCGDLEIVVGECGWPTSGGLDATVTNAQTFNQNLIHHCKSGKGTPRYPGKQIQCFVFEMYDEDTKPVDAGQFERFWGVKGGNGSFKYGLNW